MSSKIYISKSFLIKLGLNKRTLENYLSRNKKGKCDYYFSFKINKKIWILLNSLPLKVIENYNIPTSKNIIKKINQEDYKNFNELKTNKVKLQLIICSLTYSWNNKSIWFKYRGYYFDYNFTERDINLFSKTHSLFLTIIELRKSYKMKDIFIAYQNFDEAKFQTKNINSFYNKINKAEKGSINETLIHSTRKHGKLPYKLKPYIQKLIKKHYSNPKQYSIRCIYLKVNNNLINRGLKPISYATIHRYVNLPEVRNLCDPFRMGIKYTNEYILPSMVRKKPEFPCAVIQIDSTRINIPYFNKETNNIEYLYLCVGLDVYSNKILGYSFGEVENTNLILECYKNILSSIKVFPYQFLIDNHTSYSSKIFKEFKYKLETFGVLHRSSKIKNPQDKGNVERWFNTFQSRYLNSLFGSLREGITTKKIGGRINHELEQFYRKKNNLRLKNELVSDLTKFINKYNSDDQFSKDNLSPDVIFIKSFVSKNYKPILIENLAFLFSEEKYLKVRKSTIQFEIRKTKYHYIIYNTHLANKLNGIKVLVRFDPNDLSIIRIFDIKTGNYLGEIERYFPVEMLPNQKELKRIDLHQSKIKKRIKKHIDIINQDILEGEEELNFYPVLTFNNNNAKKLEIEDKEMIEFSSKTLLKHYRLSKKEPFNSIIPRKKLKRRKINQV
ncbi:Mu transposase C-terminal domain-containing protein [Tenacibaculum holothuriorum]|uniref:Mu transposase C-terminal domain-containing protein n=1 Tax=Tenacibaculum holothuriorum TaxID=1635173 RepID=UPI001E63611B|nr:Mu transposase C-terminal domain-containing protein [Tenacibaculum holothuriorum]